MTLNGEAAVTSLADRHEPDHHAAPRAVPPAAEHQGPLRVRRTGTGYEYFIF